MSTSETNASPKPFVVQAPFDDLSFADIVLRSSDGVDFYVIKGILAMTSPVFHDILSIPTPAEHVGPESPDPDPDDVSVTANGLPIITMHESSAVVLDALLRVLYPNKPPIVNDLDILFGVAAAARKYEMHRATEFAEESLHGLIRSGQPEGTNMVEVYGLACQYDLAEVVRAAAFETLKKPFGTTDALLLEKRGMSLTGLWRLLDYRRRVERRIADWLFGQNLPNEFACKSIDKWGQITLGRCDGVSVPWLHWRSHILRMLPRAPLGTEIVTSQSLHCSIVIAQCPNCSDSISTKVSEIVENLKSNMIKIASEVCHLLRGNEPH